MGRPRADVTDAELAVLKCLWERGPSTIRQLTDRLYRGAGASGYSTVQKLLERLEHKRCVERRQDGRTNVYSASVGRAELIAHRIRETADQLCEGSLSPLLTQLVSASRLSAEDLAMLREMLAAYDADRAGRGG